MSALTSGVANGALGNHGVGLDAKVLVLNRFYSAIRVIDARRAFVLLAKEIAEVIAITLGVNAATIVDRSDIANFHLGGLFEKPEGS